ncbi:MAG TPA: phosphodiesterase, partial [Sulfitobacter sp.]|nr:phosphodiesterase [Sulfitobacter sp.]
HVNLARISFDDGKKAFTKAEARQFDRASGEFVL